MDVSTLSDSPDTTVMSAETRLPARRTTRSPTTSWVAGSDTVTPSRRTTVVSGSRSLSFAAACSARNSWTKAKVPFTTITTKMAMPNSGIPATHNIRAKK